MSRSMPICLDLCLLHALCYLPCACVLHAFFMCLGLNLVCHAMCYCSPFVPFYRIFLCFGPMVRTGSRPYGLCHRPYTKAYIKGFGSSYLHVCACLLLCFMLVLASLVLGFTTLDAFSGFMVVWLHLTPMRHCLDVTIWDASPWCRLLRAYLYSLPFCVMICLPCLFVPLVGFLCIFTRLHVHAWVLLVNVSSMLQHNEVRTFDPNLHLSLTNTTFCLLSRLFVFSLVCLLTCLLAFLCFACHIYHAYLLYASFICTLHLFASIACLLVSFFYLCMYTHGARTHGARMYGARARSPKCKQKRHRCKHVDCQVATFS